MKNSDSNFENIWDHLKYELNKFWKNAWPIDWSNLLKPNLVLNAITQASNILKFFLVLVLLVFTINFGLFLSSFYQAVTVVVPNSGGVFREALVGGKLQRFNPVLPTTENEKKVINLLYKPLYKVNYPDFLTNFNSNPEIETILLNKEPQWEADKNNPSNIFHSLIFSLKSDLKWSNGSNLDNRDVLFTFQLLSQEGANPEFKNIFKDYILENVENSSTDFRILPKPGISTDPQLIYLSGFFPISKSFYSAEKQNLSIESLLTDTRSVKVSASSGDFFIPERVKNLDQANSSTQENPTWNNQAGTYTQVILNANEQDKNNKGPFLKQYIFDLYDSLDDSGSNGGNSLEKNAMEGRVDLYTRFLNSGVGNSQKFKEMSNLEQKTLPTNNYLNYYLNIAISRPGFDGYFINQNFRKYVLCQANKATLTPSLQDSVEILPTNKRLIPLHFNSDSDLDCQNVDKELQDYRNESGGKAYTITTDPKTGQKKVSVFADQAELKILALEDFKEIAVQIQNLIKDSGIEASIDFANASNLDSKIREKAYHIALVPNSMLSTNPYSTFGVGGQNISNISQNPRINGKNIEEKLKAYSDSNLQNLEVKDELVEFFKTQFVSLNLFRLKKEINYSNKVKNIYFESQDFSPNSFEFYQKVPGWYTNTKRRIKWFR